MRTLLACGGALLGMAVLITCASAATNGVVLLPTSNMHSGPSEETDVTSQAIYGTNVQILEERNNWARVRTPDDYSGWMHRSALFKSQRHYASQGAVVQVTSLFCNLYRETTVTSHRPVVTIPFESRLEVVNPDVIGAPDKNGTRWMQVRLPDDRSAYLQAGDVSTDNPKLNIRQMIELSHKFIGLPYLWGGVSTFGFDCSGFTQMLLRQRGILMPRDAGPQAAWSGVVPVPRSNLRPGDLLFFGDSATKITHTGLYIGNGEFINATAHGRPIVQIERLSDPYRAHALVAARRPK